VLVRALDDWSSRPRRAQASGPTRWDSRLWSRTVAFFAVKPSDHPWISQVVKARFLQNHGNGFSALEGAPAPEVQLN
jgi:hypothetical protein